MSEVIQVDGAPGTGKSHTMREWLAKERDEGLKPHEFYWSTFTVAAREDVQPQLREIFPRAESVEERATTLHSLALSLLVRGELIDMNPREAAPGPIIVQGTFGEDETDPFKQFANSHGMRYDAEAADPRKLLRGDEQTNYVGNRIFAVNDYLRQTCKSPDQWQDAPVDIPLPKERVETLLEKWTEYKREAFPYRLFEHGDYIDMAYDEGVTPAVDVLLIDEFQDFAPLEYRLYKQWRDSGVIDRIYLAGDPNQSIYGFRGATSYYFKNTDRDELIDLKESYRCPAEIAAVGNAVLSSHPETDPRGFAGRDSGGTARWLPATDKWDLQSHVIESAERYAAAETPVMMLTRTNRQLRQLTKDLRVVGIPFEILGTVPGVWRGTLSNILKFLNNWKAGGSAFVYENLDTVLENLPDGAERKEHVGYDGAISISRRPVMDREAIADAFTGFADAREIADTLTVDKWKRDVLINALDAPAAISPADVKVGTIHTAKGLEAPSVYLFTTTSKETTRKYARSDTHAAEEHRVYYVGATRASEELNLLRLYFDGPTAPPIRKLRANGGVV